MKFFFILFFQICVLNFYASTQFCQCKTGGFWDFLIWKFVRPTAMNCNCVLSVEDRNLIYEASNTYNVTIAVEDQVEAVVNIKAAKAQIENNNRLFSQGKSNFDSKFYPHNAYTNQQLKRLAGSLPAPPEKNLNFDLTLETFDNKTIQIPPIKTKRALSSDPRCQNLPDFKNWAIEGKTCAVQDQAQCGCCYVFASTAVLESSVAIEYGTAPTKLSLQHNLECVKNQTGDPLKNACDPGIVPWMWEYAKSQRGIVLDSAYVPYNQNPSGTCKAGLARDTRAEVDYWVMMASGDEDAMKCRIAKYGPISVSIVSEKTSLFTYKSGIWDDPEGVCASATTTDHAVYLVGYGSEMSQTGQMMDYWIIQNSWGTGFGLSGFFKMKRGVNLCRVATQALYPVLKMSTPKPLEPINPPSNCLLSGNVYSTIGAYIKSFCADNYIMNYEDSRTYCLKKGMRLYQFDSVEANTTLLSTADATWTKNFYEVELFVSGTGSAGCSAIYNNNPWGPYRTISTDCSKIQRNVCEYINFNLAPSTTTTTTSSTTTPRTTTTTLATTTTKPTTTTTKPTTTTTTPTTTTTTPTTTTTKPTTTTTTPTTTTTKSTTTTTTPTTTTTKPTTTTTTPTTTTTKPTTTTTTPTTTTTKPTTTTTTPTTTTTKPTTTTTTPTTTTTKPTTTTTTPTTITTKPTTTTTTLTTTTPRQTTTSTSITVSKCDDESVLIALCKNVPAGCETCNVHKPCCFFFDQNGLYSCVLYNVEFNVQSISGNHATVNGTTFTDADVKAVYLKNSIMSKAPRLLFEKFPNTEFLSMPNTEMITIDENMFELCQNLKSLDVSDNMISIISNSSLQKCQKLETLNLAGNPVTELNSELFKLEPQLKEIYLRKI